MGRDGTSDYGKDRTECDAARTPRGCTLPKNLSSDVVRAHCVSRFLCRYVRTTQCYRGMRTPRMTRHQQMLAPGFLSGAESKKIDPAVKGFGHRQLQSCQHVSPTFAYGSASFPLGEPPPSSRTDGRNFPRGAPHARLAVFPAMTYAITADRFVPASGRESHDAALAPRDRGRAMTPPRFQLR